MTDDQRDINRRVALAMGWRVEVGTYKSSRGEVPCYTLICGDGSAVLGRRGNVWGWGRCCNEEDAWVQVPNFCADPAAADLVRLEIVRRGWMLTRIDYRSERPMPAYPSQHRAQIHTGHIKHDDGIWGMSDDSPHMALCRAFLAACEAKAEEGGEE